MKQNLVYIAAGIAVVALVGFAVFHSTHRAAPQSVDAVPPPLAAATQQPAATPEPDKAPRIEPQELKALLDKGGATVLDVRDADAYVTSHIPGALQIPVARVEGEVPYLPKEKPIVTYCTCPHDELAIEAVQILQHAGIGDARVLHGGLQAWMALGYDVGSGAK